MNLNRASPLVGRSIWKGSDWSDPVTEKTREGGQDNKDSVGGQRGAQTGSGGKLVTLWTRADKEPEIHSLGDITVTPVLTHVHTKLGHLGSLREGGVVPPCGLGPATGAWGGAGEK